MESSDAERLGQQLAKPSGAFGLEVAQMMHKGNAAICHDAFKALEAFVPNRVLELGMGNGQHSAAWAEKLKVGQWLGLDHAPDMVKEAERLQAVQVASGRMGFYLAQAEGMVEVLEAKAQLKTGFDAAISVNTLYFWENPEEVLAQFFSLLKPGAPLILAFRSAGLMRQLEFTRKGFRFWEADALWRLLEKAGFVPEPMQYWVEPEFEFKGKPLAMDHWVAKALKPADFSGAEF